MFQHKMFLYCYCFYKHHIFRSHVLKLCLDDDANSPNSVAKQHNNTSLATTKSSSTTTPRRSSRSRGQLSYKSQVSSQILLTQLKGEDHCHVISKVFLLLNFWKQNKFQNCIIFLSFRSHHQVMKHHHQHTKALPPSRPSLVNISAQK